MQGCIGGRPPLIDFEMRMKKGFWQFVKFAIVGLSNTLISEGIYTLLVFFRVHYLLAAFIGFSLSVCNAYYWSSRYIFNDNDENGNDGRRIWWKQFIKTYLAYFWGYLVSAVLLVFWVEIVDVSSWMVPLAGWFAVHGAKRVDAAFLGRVLAAGINMLITVPMNFVLNKYWAYGKKKDKNKQACSEEE